MQIAIYEPVHLDWIVPYMELLMEEQVEVSFFTHVKFKKDLEAEQGFYHPRFSWYFFNADSSVLEHQKDFKHFLQQHKSDLIILNSVESRHLVPFFNLLLFHSGKLLINVHEVNNFFLSRYNLSLKHNLRTLGKKALKTLSNGFVVNAKAMKGYIEEKGLTPKPVYWLPPVFYKEAAADAIEANKISIVVPGTIDKRRRNYDMVLDALETIFKKIPGITLVLAGAPDGAYGENIRKRGNKMEQNHCRVVTFDSEIPEKYFQELIRTSTFIISPLVYSSSIHDGIKEIYGLTKFSGTIYDAIRYGKPLMLPTGQIVPEEIQSSCIFYNTNEDFIQQLTHLLTEEAFLKNYMQKAKSNAQFFSKTFTAGRLRAMLSNYWHK